MTYLEANAALTVADLIGIGAALRTDVVGAVTYLTKADAPAMIHLMDTLGQLGTATALALADKIGENF